MDIALKTVIYEKGNDLYNFFIKNEYSSLGFDCISIQDNYHNLFVHNSQNKVDLLVVLDKDMEFESLSYILDIVYQNYCKNIIVVSNDRSDYNYCCISGFNEDNFDLKLSMKLLEIKKQINSLPCHNRAILNRKIRDILSDFKFCQRHNGYKYYTDASLMAYLAFPFEYSTMKIYDDIAQIYGKTACSVEKSMRKALCHAVSEINQLSPTLENMKLKDQFTHASTNNQAISMVVGMLLRDKEINNENLLLN